MMNKNFKNLNEQNEGKELDGSEIQEPKIINKAVLNVVCWLLLEYAVKKTTEYLFKFFSYFESTILSVNNGK